MSIETKECSKCHEEKPLDEFYWKNKAKGKRNAQCNICIASYNRFAYREYNGRSRRTARGKIRRLELRTAQLEYLSTHPCVDCGEADPVVLEFDHVRGVKLANIAQLIIRKVSWNSILAEIKKCDVVCANCHKRRTAKAQNWYGNVVLGSSSVR